MIKTTARLGLLGAALMLGSLAAAPAYAAGDPATVPAPKRLGTLGGNHSVAIDVNDRGQVVGESTVDPNDGTSFHAFLWQRGVMKDIGAGFSPVDLNNKGHIAVNVYNGGVSRAGLWRGGKITDLGSPGESWVHAVNDNDEVVGSFTNAANRSSAFVWRRGVFTELPGPGTAARGINNKGVIVGSMYVNGVQRGVVWRGGQPVELGGRIEDAVAINDHGVIVGNGRGVSGWVNAFVWKNGSITTLPALKVGGNWHDYTLAKAINNRGEILGDAADGVNISSAVWRNGKAEDMGYAAHARGINNRGQIVGYTVESPNPPGFIHHAVIWG
jgi:probable HAF family extracellular repeat protein